MPGDQAKHQACWEGHNLKQHYPPKASASDLQCKMTDSILIRAQRTMASGFLQHGSYSFWGLPIPAECMYQVGRGQLTPTPQVTEAAKLRNCQAHGAGTGWSSEMQCTLYTLISDCTYTLLTLQGRSIFAPLSRTWEVPQTFRAGEPSNRASQSPQELDC